MARYREELEKLGFLSKADSDLIEALAILDIEAKRLLEKIYKEGTTGTDSVDTTRRSPELLAYTNVLASQAKIRQILGLVQKQRAEAKTDEAPETSIFDLMHKKRKVV